MPRKPCHCVIKQKPMATRSSYRVSKSLSPSVDSVNPDAASATHGKHSAKFSKLKTITPKPSEETPVAALIAAALKIDHSVSTKSQEIIMTPMPTSPLRVASSLPVAPTISPSLKTRSKRRKREAIQLPPGLAAAKLSVKEVKRLKNRIAANRLRQRSQQDVRSLQEQLKYYKTRCEFLEIVVSGCFTCASLGAVHYGEIELIPVETKEIKIEKEQSSSHELEIDIDDDGKSPVLTEAECVVLDNVLQS